MTDPELLSGFVRIEKTASAVRILVREITWNGPHTRVSRWKVGANLPEMASEADIQRAAVGLLDDRAYFRLCGECGVRHPVGCMLDEHICHGCAEKHGVVY